MKLFILDDEVWMRRGIKSILDSSGLDVEVIGEAGDGVEGLEIVGSLNPDILLVDIRMPGIDGLNFISEAMKVLQNSKFIIISGYDDFNYAKRAISLQVIDYILKPIDSESLINSIQKAIALLEEERLKKDREVKKEWLLNQSSMHVKEKILMDLISQDDSSFEIVSMNELFGVDLEECCFIWIAVKVLNLERIIREKGEKEVALIKFILKNYAHELTIQTYQGVDFFDDKGVLNILLMDYKSKQVKIHQMKHALCNTIRETTKKLGFFSVRIASGGIHKGVEGIKLSYNESIKALKSAVICEMIDSAKKRKIKYISNSENNCLIQKDKQLQECIIIGDTEGIKDALIDMVTFSLEDENPVKVLEEIIELMCHTGYKVIIDKAIAENSIRKISKHEKDIIYYDNPEHIIGTFFEYFSSISSAIHKISYTSGKKAIEEIKHYIQTHYNEDITLIQLSKMLHMNPTYLSEVFKENTGKNFIEYLTNFRMQKACEYLTKHTIPINKIAELVGYENERYFSTVFKKVLNTTPKEYRNKHR